jgi:periplasmic divalent cation tolerance protein
MNDYLVVLVTATSEIQARRIARKLLQNKLAACVNLIPVQSLFVWQSEIQEEEEILMIIKTRQTVFDDLLAVIKALHTYEVPEIIGMPIVMGSNDYLKWIANEVGN